MSEKIDYSKGIYDAKSLGTPKLLILGTQHMFAMFGATVLVPLLTGLSVSTTLLCAGLGTLLFHFLCKGKVPAFLGSSFAYLGGFTIVTNGGANPENLPYACAAVALSGLVYVLFSALISAFGIRKMMRFFPPVVTGPIIIAIGLILAPSAISNCQSNWLLAFVALATVIVCNIWGKGMVKILPILIGVLVAYAVALVTGAVDYQAIGAAAWFGIPIHKDSMGLFAMDGSETFISAVFTIVPIALATMMEHIGDIAAISATTGKNYIRDPGLNKTLLGDGLATAMAGLLGGPANTTYGENTGVLALTKIYDPLVIRIAAVFAMILSFCPKFEAIINTIPSGIVGGISFVLYGMISAIGVRNVVENRVDFSNSRNLIIAAVILVCALGFNSVGGITFAIAGVSINLSGLAIAAIAGILLNALLPGNDYQLDERQLRWLGRDLETVGSDTPLVVCMHVPVADWTGNGSDGTPEFSARENQRAMHDQLMPLLARFDDVRLLTGHNHRFINIPLTDRIFQHTLVSASAVSWKINGPESRLVSEDGSPGGYLILRYRGGRADWQFKPNGYRADRNQFRVYDLNQVPEEFGGQPGSNRCLINVYNWDERWTVRVRENGRDLKVEQVWAKDPLYILIRRDALPTRPTAFRAVANPHMFSVEASAPDTPK